MVLIWALLKEEPETGLGCQHDLRKKEGAGRVRGEEKKSLKRRLDSRISEMHRECLPKRKMFDAFIHLF